MNPKLIKKIKIYCNPSKRKGVSLFVEDGWGWGWGWGWEWKWVGLSLGVK